MTKLVLSAFICVHLRLIALPLWFEPNQGQSHPSVQFLARTSNGYVYVGRSQMAVQVNGKPVRMNLEGANDAAQAVLEEPLGGISSYFSGQTEKDWHTGIPHYARVRYKNVYPGIDLIYYASGGNLEYDFRLQPNADPHRIQLAYNDAVTTDPNGDLLIGGLRQKRPKVYQGGREVACDYLVRDSHHVQLALAHYDRSQPLTVDPELVFSTYLGGPGNDVSGGITLDSSGFIYLGMSTQSPAAPILNPFQQQTIETLQPAVFKFTPDGQKIVFYAILNSLSWDSVANVAVDQNGSPILIGQTESAHFPLKNPIKSTFSTFLGTTFVTKFAPDGRSLIFSTYYGGSYMDLPRSVTTDQLGNIYFTGWTQSSDLLVKNAVQPRSGGGLDCFVGKLSPTGDLLFSTYYGGTDWEFCNSVAIAPDGGVLVAGGSQSSNYPFVKPIQTARTSKPQDETPTMLKLSGDGQTVIFATYFGGPTNGQAEGVTTDSKGNIYATGSCGDLFTVKNAYQSTDVGAYYNVFLAEYDSTMENLVFSTYLGGSSGLNDAYGIAVDSKGNIFIDGYAASADFPQKNSLYPFLGGGPYTIDGFVAKFDSSGELIYSTFFGGSHGDSLGSLALDSKGDVYIYGSTNSSDFPVRNAFQSTYGGGGDAFLALISDNTAVLPSPLTVSPGSVTFQYIQTGPTPQPQTITVTGPSFEISQSDHWLHAEQPASGTIAVSVIPGGLAPGTYNGTVTLTPQTGVSATIAVALTVLAPSPVLSSITPSAIPIGSDATTITLHGSGFTSLTSILLAGTTWDPFPVTFVNSETLQVTLPKADLIAQATLPLSVQNPQSAASDVVSLTIGQIGPQVAPSGVVNAASFEAGPVAPGEIVSIFGTNLVKNVTFDGTPATMVFFSPQQMDVTVPYAIAGQTTTQLIVGQLGISAATVALNVALAAPGIFAAVPVGKNIVTLYATGCGVLTNDTLPRCALPVSVTANGQPGHVLYAGIAPGLPQGVDQINLQLPDSIASGKISIVLSVGNASSKPFEVTLP